MNTKNTYFCNCCLMHILKSDFFKHIASYIHKENKIVNKHIKLWFKTC